MKHILDLTIKEIHDALMNREITPLELTKEALKRAKESKENAFEIILEEDALSLAQELTLKEPQKDKIMWGIPFVAKDNFSVEGKETTASSNILNGYIPLFNATVIDLLKKNGAILIAKTTLDELAMGGTGTTGHKGTTYNPYDKEHKHLMGGSSAGSAASVASGIVPFALGSDTGDSVRKPASYGALVGFKPTWGLISRFGLFPFAPSLDHVAYFTRSVDDASLLLDVLAKEDLNDSTCFMGERPSTYFNYDGNVSGKRIAVIKEILDSIKDENILNSFQLTINELKKNGAIINIVSVDKDLLKAIYPAYIVISSAEATSNNANLDGIKFGPYYGGNSYQDVMMNSRTKGFSSLIKRRFVLGSYALMKENQEEVFLRAQKVRHLVVDVINDIFLTNDAIYLPSAPTVAPLEFGTNNKLSSSYLIADNHLAIANFGGYPSITIPLGFKDGLPYGANVTSKPYDEIQMFCIAKRLEEIIGLKNITSLNYKKRGF